MLGKKTTDDSIDDIKESGFYLNPKGTLPSGGVYGILLCFKVGGGVVLQIFTSYPDKPLVYLRRYWGGWSEWVRLDNV
jgi:hypothetical protein